MHGGHEPSEVLVKRGRRMVMEASCMKELEIGLEAVNIVEECGRPSSRDGALHDSQLSESLAPARPFILSTSASPEKTSIVIPYIPHGWPLSIGMLGCGRKERDKVAQITRASHILLILSASRGDAA